MTRAVALLALALACGGSAEPRAVPEFDPALLDAGAGHRGALPHLASNFYQRIANRRFNSIATYRDPALREFFHSERSWSDYYADLVQTLTENHFEALRPTKISILDIVVEELPGEAAKGKAVQLRRLRARVRVRFTGENGLPLRWWQTSVVREDRWEQEQGRWWIIPGKV